MDACDLPRPVVRDSKSSVSTYSELDWVYRVREELDEALAAERLLRDLAKKREA